MIKAGRILYNFSLENRPFTRERATKKSDKSRKRDGQLLPRGRQGDADLRGSKRVIWLEV